MADNFLDIPRMQLFQRRFTSYRKANLHSSGALSVNVGMNDDTVIDSSHMYTGIR